MKRAFTPSVQNKPGTYATKKMKEEGDFYWLKIQLGMMENDGFGKNKLLRNYSTIVVIL